MGGGGGGGDGATNKCEFLLCTRIFVNVDVIGKYSMLIWSGQCERVHDCATTHLQQTTMRKVGKDVGDEEKRI